MSPRPARRRPAKRRKVYRETPDVREAIGRLVLAVGRRVATEDVDGLDELVALERTLGEAFAIAVDGLRRNYSDREIGDRLGITRQAVQQKWPRPRGQEEESDA